MAEGKFIVSAQNKIKEGLDSAQKDTESFGSKVKSIFSDITLTAGDFMGAIKGVASTVGEFFTEYADQQKSLLTFNTAIQQSEQLTTGAADRLKEYASAMALKTGADDDAIMSMESLLASGGRTEEQIKKIIATAADMSLVMGGDLASNVEVLNKMFSGSAGLLAKNVLGLQGLTAEEFKAGKGIDVVSDQFKGQADAMGGSASVALGNLKNTIDDTKAALGEALMPAAQPVLEAFVNFLNDPLIPAIKGFAPIVKDVFSAVSGFITDMKPVVEPILKWFGEVWTLTIGPNIQSIGDILKSTLGVISGILTGDWKKAWENGKKIVTDVIDIISRAFQPIITTVNNVVNGIETALQKLGLLQAKQKTDTKYVTDKSGKIIGYYDESGNYNKYASGTNGAAPGLALVGERGPELVVFNGGEQVIPNHLLPKELGGIRGYAGGTDYGAGGAASFQNPVKFVILPTFTEKLGLIFRDALGVVGKKDERTGEVTGGTEVGNLLSGLTSMGDVVGNMVGSFGSFLGSLSSVNAILNPFSTILSSMLDIIEPILNKQLAPLVGILDIVGSTLGDMLLPILEGLTPVVNALATAFVWLYNNVIVPVGNLIYSMMATVWNGIAAAINFLLGWLGVSLAYIDDQLEVLDKISLDDVKASGESTVSDSTSTTSASYASQSITVNIYQQGILIGDDGMATLARTVRDEIDYLAYKGR